MSEETQQQDNKIPVRIVDVISMLESGKDRKAIQTHYGLTNKEASQLFRHEDLKGRKVHQPSRLVIIEEGESETVSNQEVITQNESTNTVQEPQTTTEQYIEADVIAAESFEQANASDVQEESTTLI